MVYSFQRVKFTSFISIIGIASGNVADFIWKGKGNIWWCRVHRNTYIIAHFVTLILKLWMIQQKQNVTANIYRLEEHTCSLLYFLNRILSSQLNPDVRRKNTDTDTSSLYGLPSGFSGNSLLPSQSLRKKRHVFESFNSHRS